MLGSPKEVQLIKHNLVGCMLKKWNSFYLGVTGLEGFPRGVKFMGDQGVLRIYVDMVRKCPLPWIVLRFTICVSVCSVCLHWFFPSVGMSVGSGC